MPEDIVGTFCEKCRQPMCVCKHVTHRWRVKKKINIVEMAFMALNDLNVNRRINWSLHQRKSDNWYVITILSKSFCHSDLVKCIAKAVEYAAKAENIKI